MNPPVLVFFATRSRLRSWNLGGEFKARKGSEKISGAKTGKNKAEQGCTRKMVSLKKTLKRHQRVCTDIRKFTKNAKKEILSHIADIGKSCQGDRKVSKRARKGLRSVEGLVRELVKRVRRGGAETGAIVDAMVDFRTGEDASYRERLSKQKGRIKKLKERLRDERGKHKEILKERDAEVERLLGKAEALRVELEKTKQQQARSPIGQETPEVTGGRDSLDGDDEGDDKGDDEGDDKGGDERDDEATEDEDNGDEDYEDRAPEDVEEYQRTPVPGERGWVMISRKAHLYMLFSVAFNDFFVNKPSLADRYLHYLANVRGFRNDAHMKTFLSCDGQAEWGYFLRGLVDDAMKVIEFGRKTTLCPLYHARLRLDKLSKGNKTDSALYLAELYAALSLQGLLKGARGVIPESVDRLLSSQYLKAPSREELVSALDPEVDNGRYREVFLFASHRLLDQQ